MRERKTMTTGLAGGLAALAVLGLAGCNRHAALPESATFGPHPTLVKPHGGLVPTVKIAKVVGWPAGRTPVAAPGLKVEAFATGLDHPRWILPLPNGDLLVAESNTPSGLKGTPGLRGVAATAPYLHDGSAASLCDAVKPHAIDANASPPVLDAAQRSDLVAFLRTLSPAPPDHDADCGP